MGPGRSQGQKTTSSQPASASDSRGAVHWKLGKSGKDAGSPVSPGEDFLFLLFCTESFVKLVSSSASWSCIPDPHPETSATQASCSVFMAKVCFLPLGQHPAWAWSQVLSVILGISSLSPFFPFQTCAAPAENDLSSSPPSATRVGGPSLQTCHTLWTTVSIKPISWRSRLSGSRLLLALVVFAPTVLWEVERASTSEPLVMADCRAL